MGDDRLFVLAGAAVCKSCSTLAADFHARREISGPVPQRTGWRYGHIDLDALSASDPEALASEVATVEAVLRPLQRFVDAARATLAGAQRDEIAHLAGRHIHRTDVVLPDGTTVMAVSFDARDPYAREHAPGFGLYLDERWDPPWDHAHVDWPDFGVASDEGALRTALASALERARGGERVEIGCLGAHGRTGTALACLAVLVGHAASEAVAWVRASYCPDAVETGEQERFVAAFQPSA